MIVFLRYRFQTLQTLRDLYRQQPPIYRRLLRFLCTLHEYLKSVP
nr:MAG TPA: hypothetical protein [Caudoviricetes sp.]